MNSDDDINYQRIAGAIHYLSENFKNQPSLDEIAEQVHLSPFHFQRLFVDWAGTSPKKFLQYIQLEYTRHLLAEDKLNLAEAADIAGFSGTSRLHDLYVNLEGMTPAEYKNGGSGLFIQYSFAGSPFGKLIIASTTKGICYMAFDDNESSALANLINRFPNARFANNSDELQKNALAIFNSDWTNLPQIKLHLKGTAFQLKVWEALLKIPSGKLTTYGRISDTIGHQNASRAVGTAIGSNPVAFIIPCHRVIQSTGVLGGYMWGSIRKTAIIGWEAALANNNGLL